MLGISTAAATTSASEVVALSVLPVGEFVALGEVKVEYPIGEPAALLGSKTGDCESLNCGDVPTGPHH